MIGNVLPAKYIDRIVLWLAGDSGRHVAYLFVYKVLFLRLGHVQTHRPSQSNYRGLTPMDESMQPDAR